MRFVPYTMHSGHTRVANVTPGLNQSAADCTPMKPTAPGPA